MSLTKVIDPAGFKFNQPIASLVNVHRGGVDSAWITKSAAVLTDEIRNIRPEPGVQFVHLIALGDMETTGFNRNGDGFPKAANMKYHDTFVKYARWYHDHKNKPHRGDPDFGFVKHSAYNPEMRRVELIVGIREKDDPDSIQKLASGKDLEVSMACTVPHDTCTICGNKSKGPDEYCQCIKEHVGEITKQGQVVGMINDDPKFFDISKVWMGADRIARTLHKVASTGGAPISVARAMEYAVEVPSVMSIHKYEEKLAYAKYLQKLASTMTHNEAIYQALNVHVPATGRPDKVGETLLSLEKAGVYVGIEDFYRIAGGANIEPYVKEAKAHLPFIYKHGFSADELVSAAQKYCTDAGLPLTIRAMNGMSNYKTASVNVAKVAESMIIKQGSLTKSAFKQDVSAAGKALAKEYAAYKFAALYRNQDKFLETMLLLQNGIA